MNFFRGLTLVRVGWGGESDSDTVRRHFLCRRENLASPSNGDLTSGIGDMKVAVGGLSHKESFLKSLQNRT